MRATLRVNVARVEHAAGDKGRTILAILAGMGARDADRGGRLWLDVDMPVSRAEGFAGLLREWGVPRRAVEVVTTERRRAA